MTGGTAIADRAVSRRWDALFRLLRADPWVDLHRVNSRLRRVRQAAVRPTVE